MFLGLDYGLGQKKILTPVPLEIGSGVSIGIQLLVFGGEVSTEPNFYFWQIMYRLLKVPG